MSDRFFIDTNIFVYSFDDSAPEKKKIAVNLIFQGISNNSGIISYQVVQEFLNVATTKFRTPITSEDAKTYLDYVLYPLLGINPSSGLFKSAIDVRNRFRYSFYDSLIVAAALESGSSILYSEDLQNGQMIDDMTIVNPFS